jgi:CheY-like chemotaxis protein
MQRVCLIALTGYGQESDIEWSHRAGFDHHLVKPVELSRLERVLRDEATRLG